MDSHYFLSIPLPKSIRTRLASLCYGLPEVQWVEEENFHLTLRYFGLLSSSALEDIREGLKSVFFSPFSIVLQSIGHFHSRGKQGVIWVGIMDNPSLFSLKKEINQQLRNFKLLPEERFQPHITLGRYKNINPQKLGDYFIARADFQSEPIEVINCLLMLSQSTPKRMIYQTIESYPAMLPSTGQD
jgi:RNA 2',3'-cyclic 3'-phosphodiesterase